MGRPKIIRTEEERKARVNKLMNDRYHSNPEAREAQIKYTKDWVENNRDEYNDYQRRYKENNLDKVVQWKQTSLLKSSIGYLEGNADSEFDLSRRLMVLINDDGSFKLTQFKSEGENLKKALARFKYTLPKLAEQGWNSIEGVFKLRGDFSKALACIKGIQEISVKTSPSTFSDKFDLYKAEQLFEVDPEITLGIINL